MNKFCHACGMPLNKKEDFACGDESAKYCVYCANEDGSVKTCDEIFEGGVQFFMNSVKNDRGLAERLTRRNMRKLPEWQGKNCPILDGETATDDEYADMMKMMG